MAQENKTIKDRLNSAGKKQWCKFAVASLLALLFSVWASNFWVLLLIPFFLELYVLHFIPWGAWKKSENKVLRTFAEWTDAILFALVAVYLINIYLFQNYKIPTSSLEKTLLVGDYLFVSKVSYGPRSPMTPLSFPLAQHTLPIFNTKSYIENPQWEYKRLPGFGSIKLNDIVVFNFPAGDTVCENPRYQNVDYYTILENTSREAVWNNPQTYGKVVTRPVDRRENYVKRAVALPGDTFEIRNCVIHLNGVAQDAPEDVQFNYFVETKSSLSDRLLEEMQVSRNDRMLLNSEMGNDRIFKILGCKLNPDGSYNRVYHFPLTNKALRILKKKDKGLVSVKMESDSIFNTGNVFPYKLEKDWTRDNYGPIYIPKKGTTIKLDSVNVLVYEQVIRNYERNKLEIKNGQAYINGALATEYTFKMDYYWMMGDNRHNSSDSRYWGFVPEDHIVGKPVFIWISIDEDKSGFSSIRWDRLFKKIHN